MAERTQYAPGTFCWTDLTTNDQDDAKGFYTALFGWEAEDMPAGEGIYYSMMRLDGHYVAAISPQPQMLADAGARPTWNSYVSVASADGTAARAGELGAALLSPPFDVFDSGRMAALRDPQGAFLFAWEPRAHIGAGLVNAPGALTWNELTSPDLAASRAFYGGLFGWTTVPADTGGGEPYLVIRNGERANGGMRPLHDPEVPAWGSYFGTDDLERSLARAVELGGTSITGAIDIGIARVGVVIDPQGATFTLYDGEFEP